MDLNVELDANARYLWRALALSNGSVVQPSLTATIGDFSFGAWGNVPVIDSGVQGTLNELDLTLGYSAHVLGLELDPDIGYYHYPQEDSNNTAEAVLKLSYPIGPITPYTSHAFDLLKYRGSYYGNLGVTWDRTVLPGVDGSVGLSGAWADARFNEATLGVNKSAFNSVSLDLGLTLSPAKLIYARVQGEVNALTDAALRAAAQGDATTWNVGLALGLNF